MIGTIVLQSGLLATPQTDVLWAGSVLIAVLVAAGFVVLYIRKRWDPRQSGAKQGDSTILEQIEAMHRAGHITDEEFAVLRRRLLKIPSGKEESKSYFSRSDSIMDDSENIRPPGQDDPDTTDGL